MKILEKKNVQINFTESLLRMAADDVEGACRKGRSAVVGIVSCGPEVQVYTLFYPDFASLLVSVSVRLYNPLDLWDWA